MISGWVRVVSGGFGWFQILSVTASSICSGATRVDPDMGDPHIACQHITYGEDTYQIESSQVMSYTGGDTRIGHHKWG